MPEFPPGRTLSTEQQLHDFVSDRFGDEAGDELEPMDFAALALRVRDALLTRYDNIEAGPSPFTLVIVNGPTITFCQPGGRGYLAKRICWVVN